MQPDEVQAFKDMAASVARAADAVASVASASASASAAASSSISSELHSLVEQNRLDHQRIEKACTDFQRVKEEMIIPNHEKLNAHLDEARAYRVFKAALYVAAFSAFAGFVFTLLHVLLKK